MNAALVTDLHLTDAPRDAYRWALFPWLIDLLRKSSFPIYYLVLLGDLTDAKDSHNSRLVNRIVDCLTSVLTHTVIRRLYVLRGNHDGVDPACPYFRFLRHLPAIHYVDTQWSEDLAGCRVLMLPHTRNPKDEWLLAEFSEPDVIFMHATVQGAVAENGVVLDGVHHGYFTHCRADIYSGDVHVPQQVGKVQYVGAPYPIHFGDKFSGGVTLLQNGHFHSAPRFDTIRRRSLSIRSVEELRGAGLRAKDQCKISLTLPRAEYGEWSTHKKQITAWCSDNEVVLMGLELAPQDPVATSAGAQAGKHASTPSQVLEAYCRAHKINPSLQKTGLSFLDGTN